MAPGIVTAGGGHSWETGVVAELSRAGAPFSVVRRCADIADVLAIASTGQIAAALVAADLRRLDSETVRELGAFGVAVIAVHRAGDTRKPALLERIGVAAAVPDESSPATLVQAVQAALAQAAERTSMTDGHAVGSDPLRALGNGDNGAPGFVPGPMRSAAGPALSDPDRAGRSDAVERASDGVGGFPGRGDRADGDPAFRDSADEANGAPAEGPMSARRRRRGRRARRDGEARPAHAAPDGRRTRVATRRLADAAPADGLARRGRVIAVWGSAGAPGRSTVAMGLADRVVAAGSSAVLIDADVYGGVLANAFGLLDESAGLAGACRLASNGRLGPADFAGLCWQVRDRLILMTGIARADRWPELRPSAIPMVLDTARTFADVVIVDCSSVVESDEEITFDTLAPRRNGATLAVLDAADSVIAVGAADPAGMERLARGYADVTAAVAGLEPKIVFNRVRATAASVPELREASRRFCGSEPIAFLPEDRAVVDLAWQRGVALSMVKSKSPLVRAFDDLVRAVAVTPSGR